MASKQPNPFYLAYQELETEIADLDRLSFIANQIWEKFSEETTKSEQAPNCVNVLLTRSEFDALSWILDQVHQQSSKLKKDYLDRWRDIPSSAVAEALAT